MPIITLKKGATGISLPNGRHLLHLQPGVPTEVTEKQAAILADFYAEFLADTPAEAPKAAPAPAAPATPAPATASTAWLDKLLGMKKADLVALAAENGIPTEGLNVAALREALAPFEPGA